MLIWAFHLILKLEELGRALEFFRFVEAWIRKWPTMSKSEIRNGRQDLA